MDKSAIILDYLKDNAFSSIQPPKGKLKYHCVEPGAGYMNTLWDWDSYYMTKGLYSLCELNREDREFYKEMRELVIKAAKGNVLNFLDFQEEDGFIPIMIRCDHENDTYAIRPNVKNTHKPLLCQSALLACEISGDYSWIDTDKLKKYLDYYRENQYDDRSGLYFWRDDVMIGMDNNPTVFGRPADISADIYLNSYLALDMECYIKICEQKEIPCHDMVSRREQLIKAIREEMWDEYTGLFYSQDLIVKTNRTEIFHHGLGAFWKSMPLKIKFWGCYLPLMCGIADQRQAERMVKEYFDSPIFSPYGIRTLSKDEKMYNLEPSSNPSNWLGAIWTVSNYTLFSGMRRYGYFEEAEKIKNSTLEYLSADIIKTGAMSESYHPDTGSPFLHNGFLSWNCLAASIILESEKR